MPIITNFGFYPDFPEIGTPLEKFTWDQISLISRMGYAKEYFSLGDEKTIYINDVPHQVNIIGFDHDDVVDPNGYCREKAGMTFNIKHEYPDDTIKYDGLDDEADGTKYKYIDMDVHKYLDSETFNNTPGVYGKLTIDLKRRIQLVNKPCCEIKVNGIGTQQHTYDRIPYVMQAKLFLLSSEEVCTPSMTNFDGGVQYEYFKWSETHINDGYYQRYTSDGHLCYFWSRSLGTNNDGYPNAIRMEYGDIEGMVLPVHRSITSSSYIPFAFCI